MSGCATTQAVVKKDASFQKYQRVYLATFEDDPRNVLTKIKKHLEELGYEVVEADEDYPLWGTQGTGFIISEDGYVLTAAHVMGKKKEATLWLDGERYEADLIHMAADPSESFDEGDEEPCI